MVSTELLTIDRAVREAFNSGDLWRADGRGRTTGEYTPLQMRNRLVSHFHLDQPDKALSAQKIEVGSVTN